MNDIIATLREFKTYPNSFMLFPEGYKNENFRSLYKYMDLETAIICLSNNNIRFVQPSEWPDNYEKHFYNASYIHITNNKNLIPRFWACCFTTRKMSEASWNTYRYGKQGIGNRCVKFQLNRTKFRKMLRSNDVVKCTYEGFMNYSLSDYDIQHLHLKSSPYHQKIFGDMFGLNWYFYLMLIKRSAFNYENEFRFFLTSDLIAEKGKAVFIKFDWADIIESVEVDKECSDTEINILKRYLSEAGVKAQTIEKLRRACLYDDPNKNITIE